MLLVDAVESQLCPVEIWPSPILLIIFAFDPHMPFVLSQLETVIAFFFGMSCLFQWPVNSLLLVVDIRLSL